MRSACLKIAAITALFSLALTSSSIACDWLYYPMPGGFAFPASIRAFAPDDIWALGEIGQGNAEIWHWNGAAWGFGPSPSPPPGVRYAIDGLSGTSDDDLWLVGQSVENGTNEPLALHFDGTSWTSARVVDPDGHACSPSPDEVVAVQSFSAADAIAVGLFCTTESGKPIFYFVAVHWNGAQWSVVGRVRSGEFDYRQDGGPTLSATSSDDVWLVGYRQFLHFDGTKWARMTPGAILLSAIFADTTSDAWAVGYDQVTPMGEFAAAAAHWDGSKWSHVRVPQVSEFSQLFAVTGRNPSDSWAFGGYALKGRARLLSVHWDGSRWSDAGSLDSHLGSFSIATETVDGAVWALGTRDGQPIAAHHCSLSR